MDEDPKCAVLVEMMPTSLRHHLQLNARNLTAYLDIRAEVVSYLETRRGGPEPKDDPMDVGAFQHGGKGRGKGKDDKGGKGGAGRGKGA